MRKVLSAALDRSTIITVPTPVVGQWWRGSSKRANALLRHITPEVLSVELAQRTGEALAATGGSDFVDALVMVSAAKRGDKVYTSDYDDLATYLDLFPEVRVFKV